jgi:hypothetical protein
MAVAAESAVVMVCLLSVQAVDTDRVECYTSQAFTGAH